MCSSDLEVRRAAEHGELRGWSFGFMHPKSEYTEAGNGIFRRSLSDFDLVEVSILTKMPAYFGTSVELRSADTAEETERRATDDAAQAVSSDHTAEINAYKRQIAQLCCG